MKFIRYGLFGSCAQKAYDPNAPQDPKKWASWSRWFHYPPAPWGMYAMPQEFQELALLGKSSEVQELNCSWQELLSMKTEFSWEGELWHHLGEWCKEEDILAQDRTWVKTSIDVFERALIEDVLFEEDRRKRNGEEIIHFLSNDGREVFIEHPIARQQ